ncbi:MAG TPA: phosphoenolpyruvate--protein phosphotransferase [Gemmataceae bacterium]|nr:phosphoenolpyruvate--protein phosphotransferase [Gemmataceae bacterium]
MERTAVVADPEVTLTGQSIAPGLAMGPAWVVSDVLKWNGPVTSISRNDVDKELVRLGHAFDDTLSELDQYAVRIEKEFGAALGGIFRAHGEMLRSLYASGEFERELRHSLLTAEAVVRRVLQRWYQKFEAIENQTLRQRADDVLDLGRNIIRRLRGEHEAGLQAIPDGSILVAEHLLPSDVVLLPRARVAAIVVQALGHGSHAALLAREKGIPTLAGFPGLLSRISTRTELLVDGFTGTLVIAPKEAARTDFQERITRWRATLVRCQVACHQPARTLDGQGITVEANIGIYDDVELALDNGADGVGLLRIEQLYFARPSPPTEDELFSELEKLIAPLGKRPVTIRLLDIGGDKPLPYLGMPPTSNPSLGRRGVRFLLDFPQLVRTQLGAILRLAEQHEVQVLIPMVTLEDDIRRMREAFHALCTERKIKKPPAFGAMVETPAAALSVPALTPYVDFLSIGTNDLTQYTLAAARDDAAVNDYYVDSHEAILRLLGIILADAGGRPVNVCGELAGREALVPRLLEMGYRSLSIAPSLIPTMKALIRTVRLDRKENRQKTQGGTMLCEHEANLEPVPPRTPTGCEECLAAGTSWVHLRLCLTCGHVGCCDSSEGHHATRHAHATSHPVIASYELGERWAWCYIDQAEVGLPAHAETYLR